MLLAIAALCLSIEATSSPWITPGDLRMRHDIQILSDAGVIRSPVSTWPISWPEVAQAVSELDAGTSVSPAITHALWRVQNAARRLHSGSVAWSGTVAAAAEPTALRDFGDTPREQVELAANASWIGRRFAVNLAIEAAADPDDERDLRLDGSFFGAVIGNFIVSAGAMDRWWGPGWEGSLILSTNARPIPAVAIDRNYADPFGWRVLRWLGPWRATVALGQSEGTPAEPGVPDTRFLAARGSVRPTPYLELGFTRTAQWCGGDRPCGAATLWDLIVGRDNRSDTLTAMEEPGNQLAGYDFRLRSPWRRMPAALYGQWIGEDEAGGLPSKFLGLMGLELWGAMLEGSFRVHLEYADTTCSFSRSEPQFDCAYRNELYPQGYTHRQRVIGHALDNDSRMYSVGVLWASSSGSLWSLVARSAKLNRGGAPDPRHTTSDVPAELDNLELQYNRELTWARLRLGAGYDDRRSAVGSGSTVRGFVEWQWDF